MKKGDLILYYHTGSEKSVVGVMNALEDARSTDGMELTRSKNVSLEVKPIEKLRRPISLSKMKKDSKLQDLLLLKISRLSVLPVSDAHWEGIICLSLKD